MHLQHLTVKDKAAFDQVYEIYESALPLSERKSRLEMYGLLNRQDYALMAATDGGQLTGFSVIFLPPGYRFGLLEYMATRPEVRNRGLGKLFFRNALELMQGRVMLVEVESQNGPDKELQRRRQEYYIRMGCSVIENLPYRMPQLNEAVPPPLTLMYHDNGNDLILSEAMLREWISVIYSDVYNYHGHEDDIERMVRNWASA